MALGLIEVFGFTTAVVVADAVAKAADVTIVALDKNKPAAGDAAEVPLMITVKFEGDVSAVEAAMKAGVEEAKKRDLFSVAHLISRQEADTEKMARINALGETMFAVSIDDPPDRMAVTPSGFVLHMMQLNRLYDFDEDGNLLGIREVEYERDPYMEVLEDMANLGGETALLMDAESVGGSRAEIVFAPGEGISVPDDEYSHALYHESGCALQDVWPQESGVLALIERSDGQRVGLSIDADGGVQEVEAPEPRKRNRQAVSGGTLSWSEEPGGAAVTLEDGQGREIWRVRTMIHIAADRLEWLCAQELPDGSFALGGRYLTGDGAVQEQAATMAVIGPEGVLREIVPIQSGEEDMPVGCVRDMVYDPQRGLLLLTARGGQTKNGV